MRERRSRGWARSRALEESRRLKGARARGRGRRAHSLSILSPFSLLLTSNRTAVYIAASVHARTTAVRARGLGHIFVAEHSSVPTAAPTRPNTIWSGADAIDQASDPPDVMASEEKMEKKMSAIRSSNEPEATISDGIPARTPAPRRWKATAVDITMAGSHGFKMKPKVKAKRAGILKTATATPAETRASMMPGTNSRRAAKGPTRLKTAKSVSSPLLKKMMASAPYLSSLLQDLGRPRTASPGTFFSSTPAAIWPRRAGMAGVVRERSRPPREADAHTKITHHAGPVGGRKGVPMQATAPP